MPLIGTGMRLCEEFLLVLLLIFVLEEGFIENLVWLFQCILFIIIIFFCIFVFYVLVAKAKI